MRDTVTQAILALQRLQHIMAIVFDSYEAETVALQKLDQLSYVGDRMEEYLSAFYIISDQVSDIERKLNTYTDQHPPG